MLETDARWSLEPDVLRGWSMRVERAGAHLGWPHRRAVIRVHARGASLAIAAPCDELLLATEVNEWALCAAIAEREPARRRDLEDALVAAQAETADAVADDAAARPSRAPVIDESAALARFSRLQEREARPALRALMDGARSRGLRHVLDDEALTLGGGASGRTYPLGGLPAVSQVPWPTLANIPTALVTGSNGKTTTVRLLAACTRAQGWHTGYNCTDGVFADDGVVAAGDYSGPAGARLVLRGYCNDAAVLETARGGILRRGIAADAADAAVVTNISSDHFGEYGIDDLAALADAKLTVAGVVAPTGMLVLNADDALLVEKARTLAARFGTVPPLGWFASDADAPALREARRAGASICGVRDGRLRLDHGGEHDLGRVADMPLTVNGLAAYNIANLAAAALAAAALGVAAPVIADVFARFGAQPADNPGRLMSFDYRGARVLIDYAHNPAGLQGFLAVASQLRKPGGRLGVLLGHAGNRKDEDIEELARVAADFRPELIVIKENDAQLRGRAPGEVPGLIRAELKRRGFSASSVRLAASEVEAARLALGWARAGDVLAMPVHGAQARSDVMNMVTTAKPVT